jgi:hypothetical protein
VTGGLLKLLKGRSDRSQVRRDSCFSERLIVAQAAIDPIEDVLDSVACGFKRLYGRLFWRGQCGEKIAPFLRRRRDTGKWTRKIHCQLFERHGASEPTTTKVRPFQLKGAGGQSGGRNSEDGRSDVMAKLSRRKTA